MRVFFSRSSILTIVSSYDKRLVFFEIEYFDIGTLKFLELWDQRWNWSGFDGRYRYQSKPDRTGRPAGLKFILGPLLSPDNDDWFRELETKAVYILSGRYSWDPAEVLYIFTWEKQNFNVNTRAGLPVKTGLPAPGTGLDPPVTGTSSISVWDD
jgi:hypothetical protein